MSIGASRQARGERSRARPASRETGRAKAEAPTPVTTVAPSRVSYVHRCTRAKWRRDATTRVPACSKRAPPVTCSGVVFKQPSFARPRERVETRIGIQTYTNGPNVNEVKRETTGHFIFQISHITGAADGGTRGQRRVSNNARSQILKLNPGTRRGKK